MFIGNRNTFILLVLKSALATFLICGFALLVFGQTEPTAQNATPPGNIPAATEKPVLKPLITEYKEVKIGMTKDEVKDKLGKAKLEDKDGLYYIFSDRESVQIVLDADQKVRVISTTYSGKNETTPKYEDVFGKDVPVTTKPDGSIYNLVRYPEAGIWIAYSSTSGDHPTVTITIQKL